MYRVSFITTVNHNIGDDFVREGIKYLLKSTLKKDLTFLNIHKHVPVSTRYGFEMIRSNKIGDSLDKLFPLWLVPDKVMDSNLLIQSGAPVYWCHSMENSHCYENEWYQPLIERRFIRRRKKLLNLAAGSCQTYHSDGSEFCQKCENYLLQFFKECDLTTVRDDLASKIFLQAGIEVSNLPCTSLFAVNEYKICSEQSEYVVVNYMEGGAHYRFGQLIETDKWRNEFSKFYYNLKKKHKVIFACHNLKEVSEAKKIDSEAIIFYKKNDYIAYMKFYAKAKYGVMNRIHGAYMLASLGIPSIIIGNDSRAKMAENIGLESFFVNDVTNDILLDNADTLEALSGSYYDLIIETKNKAFNEYTTKIDSVLCS